jgi:hypothetical protein
MDVCLGRVCVVDGEDLKINKMAQKDVGVESDPPWDADDELEDVGTDGLSDDLDSIAAGGNPAISAPSSTKSRLEQIKESHSLLRQFSPKELKILLNLKRNTSPKAWTLREDLVVLTLAMSNREIADLLQDRNKEAVKKRLQLLRSKGLTKRQGAESAS